MNPLVSIIVPVYNVEEYLEECIESLRHQTLTNIEIILVDDGSTDLSGEICEQKKVLDKRIKVIHKKNEGLGLARNDGIKYAQGKFIGFVDSDDFVSMDMFKILYTNAIQNNADASFCKKIRFIDSKNIEKVKDLDECEVYDREDMPNYLLKRIGMPPESSIDTLYQSSVWLGIYTKEILNKYNISFVSERKYISEDIIFNIEFFSHCRKVVHCNRHLYYYRYNPNSLTKKYKKDRFDKNIKMYKKMEDMLKKMFFREKYKKNIDRYLIVYARIACMQEVEFLRENGFIVARRNIKKICQNNILQNVLLEYPIYKLPKKYAIIAFLQKYYLADLIILIILLK